MVFRVTGVKARIDFSTPQKVIWIWGKSAFLPYSWELKFEYQTFLSSLHDFEDSLLHFVNNAHMKEIRGLLGMKVVITEAPEPSCFIVASHDPVLSIYDFQKLCSVLCAYRFFEIISLRAQCIPRTPTSTPTASLFLPGPRSVKPDLDVSIYYMLYVLSFISDDLLGIFPFAGLATACDKIS